MKILNIYCRVSSEAQVEKGHSLLAQQKAGIARAESLGMNYELHIEKGKSAAYDNVENRPVLKSLLEACDEGGVTDIYVTELDRLTRSPIAMYYIKKVLMDSKVLLHTSNQTINLLDTDDEFTSDLTALLSRRENTIRAKRSKRGMMEAVKKGKWIGKILPYGYRKDENGFLTIDTHESEIYLLMTKMSLKGNGTNTIAYHLNNLGIQTRCRKVLPNGTHVKNKFTKSVRHVQNEEFVWRPGTIYCILTNPIYTGKRRYKGEIVAAPRMIDDVTWEGIQVNLKKNKHYSINANKHFYLLRGLLRCGRCQSNLYGKIKSDERIYMCSSKRTSKCALRSPNLDKLELLVWELVANSDYHLEKIQGELRIGKHNERINELVIEVEGFKKLLLEKEKRLNNLISLFETSRIALAKFDQRKNEFDQENDSLILKIQNHENGIAQLRRAEENVTQLQMSISQLRYSMDAISREEKKEILNSLIHNIVVSWDPKIAIHTVEIDFKISGLNLQGQGFLKGGEILIEEPQSKKEIIDAIFYFSKIGLKEIPPLVKAQAH